VRVDGIGSAVPRTVVNNNALEKLVHTSDEWISTRTGIKQRFVAAAGDSFTSLAADASLRALRHARA
jgi:3-oxoacyl-[acyl-carrier-protein] synthase-3